MLIIVPQYNLSLHPSINIYLAPLCPRHRPRWPVGRRTSPGLPGAHAQAKIRPGEWEALWWPERLRVCTELLWTLWMGSLPSSPSGDTAGPVPSSLTEKEIVSVQSSGRPQDYWEVSCVAEIWVWHCLLPKVRCSSFTYPLPSGKSSLLPHCDSPLSWGQSEERSALV